MITALLDLYYDLPLNLSWSLISPDNMNESWLGTLDEQPLFVLRRYLRTQSPAEIYQEHALLAYLLGQLGELVAPPIAGKDFRTLQQINSQWVALFPFRDGIVLNQAQPIQTQFAAATLARLHSRLALYTPPPDFAQLRPSLTDRNWRLEPNLAAYWGHNPEVEELRRAGYSLEKLQQAFSEIEEALAHPVIKAARRVVIHSDYTLRNLLWIPGADEIATVLDWDETRWDIPLADVAASAFQFGRNKAEQAAFVQAYLAGLGKLDKTLANELEMTLPWQAALQKATWLAEIKLVLQQTLKLAEPLPVTYLQRLLGLIFERN